ncbi:signal peptidase II [Planctomonas psychrotolerans]|uniref:signal peptidase II n=1 Tax=Planctomonas psychrotolerans TaxID=2528712 RepID=UPI001D0D6F63|nr:signal peptidase II [Planctomonas psychrotolerans]
MRTGTLVLLVVVAAGVYAFDQISKALVVENLTEFERIPVLGDLLAFQFVRNSGAAFSLASGSTWIFTVIASAVTVFIVIFARRIRSTGWAVLFGLLLGGTVGNLTDRYFREPGFPSGHVIDFLQIPLLPAIFNIADVAIVSSMAVFLVLTLRGIGLDGTREVRGGTADPAAVHPEAVEPAADASQARPDAPSIAPPPASTTDPDRT